jgi:hypothetical protein
VAVHHYRRILQGLAADAVDQERMGQQHDVRHGGLLSGRGAVGDATPGS